MTDVILPILIVGAGPAGLATSAELSRRGIAHRVLERGVSLGQTWVDLYESLVLHTGRHMSTLPGMKFPRGTPLFPSRGDFVSYLRAYASRHAVAVESGKDVQSIVRDGAIWRAVLHGGETIAASGVVMATGIVSNPRVPRFAGATDFRGRLMHSVEYRRPDEFIGKRVLVVGIGNSGGEIGSELGEAGAHVTALVRSGAHVVPREIAGVPIQYLARAVRTLPQGVQRVVLRQVQRVTARKRGAPVIPPKPGSPLEAIPIIGFNLVDAIKAGRVALKLGTIDRFLERGVQFSDGSEEEFDVVLLATGFDAALAPLGDLVRRDAKGFAARNGRVASADQPALWFVGHNYDSTGGIANIRRDAGLVADEIMRSTRRSA